MGKNIKKTKYTEIPLDRIVELGGKN